MEQPEAVLATRDTQQQGTTVQQVLIKWHSKSDDEATWEDRSSIIQRFPGFNLEDKVV